MRACVLLGERSDKAGVLSSSSRAQAASAGSAHAHSLPWNPTWWIIVVLHLQGTLCWLPFP